MPPPTTAPCRGEPGTNTAPCWDEDMPAPSPATGAPGRGRPGSCRHRMRGDAGQTRGRTGGCPEVDGWGWAARGHAAGVGTAQRVCWQETQAAANGRNSNRSAGVRALRGTDTAEAPAGIPPPGPAAGTDVA